MRAVADWHATTGADERHIDCIGCMGAAAPLGLGLALSQPDRKVIVIDGDGSLLMQLGVLATVAGAAPENLYHVVLVNRVYETSGNQPIPGSERIDFPALAQAAGYSSAESVSDAAVLAERLPGLLTKSGPVLLAIETDAEEGGTPGSAVNRSADPAGLLRSQLAG
jgi:phosphonopyruvate decarboxylase